VRQLSQALGPVTWSPFPFEASLAGGWEWLEGAWSW